jgi:hypothetical protein
LHPLGFFWPILAFSMGYGESKEKICLRLDSQFEVVHLNVIRRTPRS